jgi:hypothetical protein
MNVLVEALNNFGGTFRTRINFCSKASLPMTSSVNLKFFLVHVYFHRPIIHLHSWHLALLRNMNTSNQREKGEVSFMARKYTPHIIVSSVIIAHNLLLKD